MNLIKKIVLLFFVFFTMSFAGAASACLLPALSQSSVNDIGKKIWQNECGGKISGLVSWNQGENFASLGIGHFIWYPEDKQDIFAESFPKVIEYLRSYNILIPGWLDQKNIPHCPWKSREKFLLAIQNNEAQLEELKQFLIDTIPQQTQYLIYRLETTLPQILELIPANERENIEHEIEQLVQTPTGIYALIDYINFKGDGIPEYKKTLAQTPQVYAHGWGLLQALREMQHAPKNLTPNQAFAWATGAVLKRRAESAPPERKARDEMWLVGWLKRVKTYAE